MRGDQQPLSQLAPVPMPLMMAPAITTGAPTPKSNEDAAPPAPRRPPTASARTCGSAASTSSAAPSSTPTCRPPEWRTTTWWIALGMRSADCLGCESERRALDWGVCVCARWAAGRDGVPKGDGRDEAWQVVAATRALVDQARAALRGRRCAPAERQWSARSPVAGSRWPRPAPLPRAGSCRWQGRRSAMSGGLRHATPAGRGAARRYACLGRRPATASADDLARPLHVQAETPAAVRRGSGRQGRT